MVVLYPSGYTIVNAFQLGKGVALPKDRHDNEGHDEFTRREAVGVDLICDASNTAASYSRSDLPVL
jgi:hypothetical protein